MILVNSFYEFRGERGKKRLRYKFYDAISFFAVIYSCSNKISSPYPTHILLLFACEEHSPNNESFLIEQFLTSV